MQCVAFWKRNLQNIKNRLPYTLLLRTVMPPLLKGGGPL